MKLRRSFAALLGLALLAGFLAGSPQMAGAQDGGAEKVWAGPGCPGGDWTCQDAGVVNLSSPDGRDLEAHCTAPNCVLVLENTTGANSASCDQQASQNATLSCELTLHNDSGPNSAAADQRSTVSSESLLLGTVMQDSRQLVAADMSNGSGDNDLEVDQLITHTASSAVAVVDSHTQEAHQDVHVIKQTSESGHQTINVNQHQVQQSSAAALLANQQQNRRNERGQHILIGGGGSVGMDTESGTNTFDYSQVQDFTQTATGLGGLAGALLQATQEMGAVDTDYPAAEANWTIDSRTFDGSHVDGEQVKNWTQHTTPASPLVGKTQNMFDILKLVGGLFTKDRGLTSQTAELEQDEGGFRRCIQEARSKAKIEATNTQTCNNESQSASGKEVDQRFECYGVNPGTDECDEEGSHNEVVEPTEPIDHEGAFGCGGGFWKNNLEAWPEGVEPGHPFGQHFSKADRFTDLANTSMLGVLEHSGGGSTDEGAAFTLGRAAVSGLLSALHPQVPHEIHSEQLRSKVNDSLESDDSSAMLELKNELEGYDEGDCPILA